MQLDIFLPKENLALEYQGEQHFKDIYGMGPQRKQKQRDDEKREACLERGITLVEVPFWWDENRDSLQNSIHQANSKLIGLIGDGIAISEMK